MLHSVGGSETRRAASTLRPECFAATEHAGDHHDAGDHHELCDAAVPCEQHTGEHAGDHHHDAKAMPSETPPLAPALPPQFQLGL